MTILYDDSPRLPMDSMRRLEAEVLAGLNWPAPWESGSSLAGSASTGKITVGGVDVVTWGDWHQGITWSDRARASALRSSSNGLYRIFYTGTLKTFKTFVQTLPSTSTMRRKLNGVTKRNLTDHPLYIGKTSGTIYARLADHLLAPGSTGGSSFEEPNPYVRGLVMSIGLPRAHGMIAVQYKLPRFAASSATSFGLLAAEYAHAAKEKPLIGVGR